MPELEESLASPAVRDAADLNERDWRRGRSMYNVNTISAKSTLDPRAASFEPADSAEERLRLSIESLDDGFALFDIDDKLVAWNSSWLRQLNPEVAKQIFQGMSYSDVNQLIIDFDDRLGQQRLWPSDRGLAYRKPRPRFEVIRGNGRRYELIEKRAPNGDTLVISRDIQNEYQQRRALERSEQRFRHFAEGASDWLWETDAELRFTYFSDAFYESSHISPSRLLGRRRDEAWGDDYDEPAWREHIEQMKRHEVIKDFAFCATDDAGRVRHFRVSGQPYWDEDGNFAGYRGTSRELSAEMHAIEREQQLLDAMRTISQGIALFDAAGRLDIWSENWLTFSLGKPRNLAKRGAALEALLQAVAEELSEQSNFSVGQWIERLRGTNEASSSDPIQYRTEDGRWVEMSVVEVANGKIAHVLSDISALKGRELDLSASETKFRDYANAASDWFWEADSEHRFTSVGSQFSKLYGIPTEDVVGKRRHDMAPDGISPELWQSHLDDLAQRRPFRGFRYSFRDPAGNQHWMETSGVPFFNADGSFAGYRGSGSCVTDEVLRHRVESRFVNALETVNDAFALFDENDRLALWNSAYAHLCDLSGLGEGLAVGQSFEDLVRASAPEILPDASQAELESFVSERMRRHRDPKESFTLKYTGAERVARWFQIRERPADDGSTLLVAHDVSELKSREDALEASETRFKQFAESAADWFWETDSSGSLIFVSDRIANLTGFDSSQLQGMPIAYLVDSRDAKKASVQRMTRRMQKMGAFENVEFRGRCAAGESMVVHSISGKPRFCADGEFLGYRGSGRDVTNARRMARQLAHQARHDALTGLVNRTEFERRLGRTITSSRTDGSMHGVCYLDLDQFKVVNDTCGHAAGDEMLRQISALLRTRIRPKDTVARLGGDEFGVLIEQCAEDEVVSIANNLRRAIESYSFAYDGKFFRTGASIGVIPLRPETSSVSEAMRAADTACHIAKDKGRNRVHVYRHGTQDISEREGELQWVHRINNALNHDQFVLYCQPIRAIAKTDDDTGAASAACGEVESWSQYGDRYEILVRMQNPGADEPIPPGAFLPAAERYNLASRIDEWVAKHTISWLQENPEILERSSGFCINLSGQSLSNRQFLSELVDTLSRSKVDANKIVFEVTETTAIADLTNARHFMEEVKAMGCQISLDDFGSGLSSFGYLQDLPVDIVKIDGKFVKDVDRDLVHRTIVQAISQIGRAMGKSIVAEWVERPSVLAQLRDMQIGYVQGHLISKPVPLDSLRHSLLGQSSG